MTQVLDERMLIRLSMVAGIGSKRISRLLSMVDAPQQAASIDPALAKKVLGSAGYTAFQKLQPDSVLDALLEKLSKKGIRVITCLSPEYPPLLAGIFDPPFVLYLKGNMALPGEKRVAMVGARRGTRYGTEAGYKLAGDLAREGVTIVSGMARGVDASCHLGALDAGGRTIAVLGCGLDVCYPPEHVELFERIALEGLLVSEYMPGTNPIGHHFIARNRIIAGLCPAVVLVEGAEKSGAMTTIDCAADQGREVFAVPGQITSPLSYHPNRLIRDGAHMALEAGDVLEVMGWGQRKPEQTTFKTLTVELTPEESSVISPLRLEALSLDQLLDKTGIAPDSLNSLLTMLELRGIIKQHPGKIFSV